MLMKKLIFYVFLIVYCVSIIPFQAVALTASEVQKQIDDTNSQIDALNKEINALSNQITATGEQKNTLNNTIKELTLTRNKLLKEKDQTQKSINMTNLVIQEIRDNIITKEESIQKSEASLKEMLYSLYQTDKYSLMERMLSQENLAEFSREYNNTLSVNEDIKNYIEELLGQKKQLSDTQSQKLDEQAKLNELKTTLTAKETAVLNTKKEKDALLAETKNKEAAYQKMLAEQLKRKDAFDKVIQDYEAQLKFILNPNLLPKEGSGVLSWPLSSVLITSPFGPRSGGFHYGVDFRAQVGTPVFAMAGGIVEGTGDTDIACKGASFGKWVFIKYNNGLSSTFGHLSVISTKKGQTVKAGDIVALSGNTGYSEAQHLHVAVYASTGVKVDTVPSKSCNGKIFTQPIAALSAYLNPLLYFPKTTASMFK
jgi:murein DD-endopeptidase MepM/ murein hydrolase activator NlpD